MMLFCARIGGFPGIRLSWAFAGGVCILLAATGANGQCQYDVTVIQAPDVCGILGPVLTFGAGLNENGAVVGRWKCPASEHDEAFVWTPDSGLTTLARPAGVSSASATDISDDGVIVGTYIVTNVGFHGFVYKDGKFTELPPLPGGAWSGASAISNAGRVAGFRSIGEGVNPFNAFIWSAQRGFIDLGVMNGPNSTAMDVNERGQVVGWTGSSVAHVLSFLWDKGRLTLIPPVGSGDTIIPRAINDGGAFVGTPLVQDKSGKMSGRAYIWKDGEVTILGPLPEFDTSGAWDLNDIAQVVGSNMTDWHSTRKKRILMAGPRDVRLKRTDLSHVGSVR